MIIILLLCNILLCQSFSSRYENPFNLKILNNFLFKTQSKDKTNIQQLKQELFQQINLAKPNGLKATPEIKQTLNKIVKDVEKMNPTSKPAYSELMNGFWRLQYSDFFPPSTSSGKLGPFVGDVFQDLNSKQGHSYTYSTYPLLS